MTDVIEHEGLEGDVFDNLERLCVEGHELVATYREPVEELPVSCTEHELAAAIGGLPSADDDDEDHDAFTPRLA